VEYNYTNSPIFYFKFYLDIDCIDVTRWKKAEVYVVHLKVGLQKPACFIVLAQSETLVLVT
jgi:hypothetical protein